MSKFGWDLPPGVTTSMLPGNTPAEAAAEAQADAVYAVLVKFFPEAQLDEAVEEVCKLLGVAYGEGYSAGIGDEKMAQEMDDPANDLRKIKDVGDIIGALQHQAAMRAPENDEAGCLLKAADALREDLVDLDPHQYGGLNYDG